MKLGNIKLLGELDATEGTLTGISEGLSGNTTVNLTSGMTAAEIQALIDAQPKNLNGYTLTFQFADGTYNASMTASLNFSNFYNGSLVIQGNTGEADATALHTSQAVYLDFSAGTSSGIAVTNCYVQLYVRNLKIRISDTGGIRCINLTGCQMSYIQYNYFLGANNTGTNVGLACNYTLCQAVANYVSTLQKRTLVPGGINNLFERQRRYWYRPEIWIGGPNSRDNRQKRHTARRRNFK